MLLLCNELDPDVVKLEFKGKKMEIGPKSTA